MMIFFLNYVISSRKHYECPLNITHNIFDMILESRCPLLKITFLEIETLKQNLHL